MHMGKWVGWDPVRVIHNPPSMSPPPAGTQPMVSHSGLTAGHQSPVGAMLRACKVLATGSFLLRPISSRKHSTFRNMLKILVMLLTCITAGQHQASQRGHFLGIHLKLWKIIFKNENWTVQANIAGTFTHGKNILWRFVLFLCVFVTH